MNDAPDNKRRRTITIVVIVAVLLCCCCLGLLVGLWFGGDELLKLMGVKVNQVLPLGLPAL